MRRGAAWPRTSSRTDASGLRAIQAQQDAGLPRGSARIDGQAHLSKHLDHRPDAALRGAIARGVPRRCRLGRDARVAAKRRVGVIAELEAAKRDGARVILASGTYQPILDAFASHFGFEAIGTPLEVVEGKLTGRLSAPVSVGTRKRANLITTLNGQPLTRAYGDTFPDMPMLELAQQPVIVRGNDAKLERIARERTWRVTQ
ncbi:MAG: hypothetical protein HC933_03355 [Pleurocapsa sp. SU_196_0]|nr:hypothetical protein [Pleurocapsa sp. SU_196_0]